MENFDLSQQILNIFNQMLENPEKITNVNYGRIWYGEDISLHITKYTPDVKQEPLSLNTFAETSTFPEVSFSTFPKQSDNYQFIITTPFKTYIVPELSRIEYAQALDKLDKILANYEQNYLIDTYNNIKEFSDYDD